MNYLKAHLGCTKWGTSLWLYFPEMFTCTKFKVLVKLKADSNLKKNVINIFQIRFQTSQVIWQIWNKFVKLCSLFQQNCLKICSITQKFALLLKITQKIVYISVSKILFIFLTSLVKLFCVRFCSFYHNLCCILWKFLHFWNVFKGW